jgi:hypothetical protein
MCGKEKYGDIEGNWSGSYGSRSKGRFRGIGKRLAQSKQDCNLVDRTSVVLNALTCFGISRLSLSKVDILEESMEGKHLVITSTLTMNDREIPTHTLNDC